MQSPNSLNSQQTDISLFFNVLNENIYTDIRFVQLMSLIKDKPYGYTYACYTESCYLKDNIYIPVFHTLYLASKLHNIVLADTNDSWVVETFPNNKYYIISDMKNDKLNKIQIINHLSEIGAA